MIKEITDEFISKVEERLLEGKAVRWKIPPQGSIHIDRPLPFLCVYRYPSGYSDKWTARLIRSEASFIIVSEEQSEGLSALLKRIVELLSHQFGACMLIELWSAPPDDQPDGLRPTFRILGPPAEKTVMIDKFRKALEKIEMRYTPLSVETTETHIRHPAQMPPLMSTEELKAAECLSLGLEVRPFYLMPETYTPYPVTMRVLVRSFSEALQRTFFDFVRLETGYKIANFQMLGSQHVDEQVWEIDRQLAEVSQSFRFLLLVSPINDREAWKEFKRNRFDKAPSFHYRLLPIDPDLLKRQLYNIPVEEVDDPTLGFVFRDKRQELDKMITMLADRNTPDFRLSSLQLFGGVSPELRKIAKELLTSLPVTEDSEDYPDTVSAEEFARLAREEIEYFRMQYPDIRAQVKVNDDMAGLMVSEGDLYINTRSRVPRHRIEALIQHEVGTHVLTYYNGKAQPLRQLYSGVPGYEELQEGLAVLSEYLVGGLTRSRVRQLAARVVAVDYMIDGATFVETFRMLLKKYGFSPGAAYSITMRVYRGGGFTKDAVYLKGLVSLLEYLKEGNDIEPLLIGKIRQDYLPIITELIHRKVLRPAPIKPRYLTDPNVAPKLEQLKQGLSVFSLSQTKSDSYENRIHSK